MVTEVVGGLGIHLATGRIKAKILLPFQSITEVPARPPRPLSICCISPQPTEARN